MIKINERYYIDADFDYGYSNSWIGHKKYYYALYEKYNGRIKRIREYPDLDAICKSLISKYEKRLLIQTTWEDIVNFVNSMIDNNKIKRRKKLKWSIDKENLTLCINRNQT